MDRGDASKKAVVSGRLCAGLGEGKFFTQLPWVKRQMTEKLGIDPYPGTLNLCLDDPQDRRIVAELRRVSGVEIVPEDSAYCSGICYRVFFQEGVEGVAVFPEVGGYPDDKLEIVASVNLKQSLGIADGDVISVTVEA